MALIFNVFLLYYKKIIIELQILIMKRTNKVLKINENAPFSMKIGTINKENPSSFFVNGQSWMIPLCDDDYNELTNKINKQFKKEISNFLSCNPNLEKKYILNFETTSNYMKKGKKTFVNFEAYFVQKDNNVKSIYELKDELSGSIIELGEKLEEIFIKSYFKVLRKK